MRLELRARLKLDSGDQLWALFGLATPSGFFEPRIISFSPIDREIAVTHNQFRISEISLELDNSDNALSKLLAAEPMRNRTLEVELGDLDGGEADFQKIFVGRITRVGGADIFRIQAADATLKKFDEVITPSQVINGSLFPALPAETARELVPLVIGKVASAKGALRAYLIDAVAFKYVATQGTAAIPKVYADGIEVAGANYSIVQEVFDSATYTLIDFAADQGNADITFDCDGILDGAVPFTNPARIWQRLLVEQGFLANFGLDFDGVDDLVTVTDQASIQNIFDSGGTIEAWIHPRSDGEAGEGRILEKRDAGGADSGPDLLVQGETAGFVEIRFFLNFSITGGFWRTNAVVPLNQWSHVAVVYNSDSVDNDPSFYLDGALQTVTELTTPVGTRASDAGQSLIMGNRLGGTRTFDGLIDEVRLWDDIRTQAEIQGALKKHLQGNESGLVAYWRFNEGSGTTANDATSNENHASNSGPGWVAGAPELPTDMDVQIFEKAAITLDVRGIQGGFAAVDKSETIRQMAEKFAESCQLTTVVTRQGKIGVTVPEPGKTAEAGLVEIDESEIVRESFNWQSPEELASAMEANFKLRYVDGTFGDKVSLSNSEQQTRIGEKISVEADLWYLRDASSASRAAQDKLFFQYEERLIVDLLADPALFRQINVGDDVRITHFAGTGQNGFQKALMRVIGVGLDYDGINLMTRLRLVDMTETAFALTDEWRAMWQEMDFFRDIDLPRLDSDLFEHEIDGHGLGTGMR